jgi:hypothetical protein
MNLPYDIHSPDQISALTMELRHYIDAQRDASRRSDHGAGGTHHTVSAGLNSLLEASGGATGQQLLDEMEALLKNAPTVHLITAIQPGHQLKLQITQWFRTNVHEHTLLTFAERRDLGGGIVVRSGSRIYDFSFKRKILDNKHRISEIAGLSTPAAQTPTQTAQAATAQSQPQKQTAQTQPAAPEAQNVR